MKFYLLGLSLTAVLSLMPLRSMAQDKNHPKTEEGEERFDQKIDNARSRFDDQLQAGQQRLDEQINNPGKTIKSKKEKKQKPVKAKKEKAPNRDVVEIECEPTQRLVKSGAFKQHAEADADRVVRGIRTASAVPVINITPEKARSEAIRIAKEEALRIAVGEEISASTTVIDHGKEDATIARISTIGSRGGIVALEMIKDQQTIDANGASRYEVEIKVDVKIYPPITTPCITFDVTGIKHGYAHRERLQFGVTPSDSCYIYIFLFDARGAGTQLVPSVYEPQNCLQCSDATTFPSNRAIQYTLTLDNPVSTEELNTLLIVTFRQKVPITPEICRDFEKTLCWIYDFDPAQRSRNIEVIPLRIYSTK